MSSDIVMPRSKPDKEGYLTKRSTWLKDWRRRYFRLIGDKLYFSKDPQTEPHGVIDLRECLTVKSAEDKTGKAHAFEVATLEQTYYMHAERDDEKDEWIGAIGKAIVRSSNSFKRDEIVDGTDSDDD